MHWNDLYYRPLQLFNKGHRQRMVCFLREIGTLICCCLHVNTVAFWLITWMKLSEIQETLTLYTFVTSGVQNRPPPPPPSWGDKWTRDQGRNTPIFTFSCDGCSVRVVISNPSRRPGGAPTFSDASNEHDRIGCQKIHSDHWCWNGWAPVGQYGSGYHGFVGETYPLNDGQHLQYISYFIIYRW